MELEHRRWLAVQRVLEGYSVEEVAEFLGVDRSSVRRWRLAYRENGMRGLAARAVSGRPSKLTYTQEKIVLRWLREAPTEHGFATELWAARRVGQLVERELGIHFHPHYLSAWLRARGFTPQVPQRRARQCDLEAVAVWLAKDWPRIKKKPVARTPPSYLSMKAAC